MSRLTRIALVLGFTCATGMALSQTGPQFRDISGSVRDRSDAPVKQAIVQLENEDTHTVQTYLTDGDGTFHFKHLSQDTDYQISASLNGAKSKGVFISKFNDSASKVIKLTLQAP